MAKKKVITVPVSERLEDLAEYAHSRPLEDGFFDDELQDVCESEAKLAHEQICSEPLLNQLEYLYHRGYSLERLKQIITEGHRAK